MVNWSRKNYCKESKEKLLSTDYMVPPWAVPSWHLDVRRSGKRVFQFSKSLAEQWEPARVQPRPVAFGEFETASWPCRSSKHEAIIGYHRLSFISNHEDSYARYHPHWITIPNPIANNHLNDQSHSNIWLKQCHKPSPSYDHVYRW